MEIEFKDIENIIRLSSYFSIYAKAVNAEQKEEFKKVDSLALESIWRIREILMLNDDFGNPILELRKKKKDEDFFNKIK